IAVRVNHIYDVIACIIKGRQKSWHYVVRITNFVNHSAPLVLKANIYAHSLPLSVIALGTADFLGAHSITFDSSKRSPRIEFVTQLRLLERSRRAASAESKPDIHWKGGFAVLEMSLIGIFRALPTDESYTQRKRRNEA
ncbi:MAG TPA: hypothetical protein VF784_12625, partial [Anaerolineales bacterium]